MNVQANLIETLEARQMLSASPMALGLASVATDNGLELRVNGTSNNDNITVSAVAGGLKVTNGTWAKTVKGDFKSLLVKAGLGNDKVTVNAALPAAVFGGNGNDTLVGGNAADKLYGQAGTDQLFGRNGNDTLVNVGDSTLDRAAGGKGFDSFWTDKATGEKVTDASADEILKGAVHKVASFFNFTTTTTDGAPKTTSFGKNLVGGNLADPAIDSDSAYKNFAGKPLFASTGPSADDISQGYVGDCWFLSAISAIAKVNPSAIRQMVVELGDGTYAVQFKDDLGNNAFVRVDADLAVNTWGDLNYAQLGRQDSLWVAIMEKAYACFREGGAAGYSDLDGGWMSEAFGDLGYASDQIWDVTNGDDLLARIDKEVKAGKAVTIAIYEPGDAPLIGGHAYTVVKVEVDANGNKVLVLRNPWGFDGAGKDNNTEDGYVKISATQAFNAFWGVISANVA